MDSLESSLMFQVFHCGGVLCVPCRSGIIPTASLAEGRLLFNMFKYKMIDVGDSASCALDLESKVDISKDNETVTHIFPGRCVPNQHVLFLFTG